MASQKGKRTNFKISTWTAKEKKTKPKTKNATALRKTVSMYPNPLHYSPFMRIKSLPKKTQS